MTYTIFLQAPLAPVAYVLSFEIPYGCPVKESIKAWRARAHAATTWMHGSRCSVEATLPCPTGCPDFQFSTRNEAGQRCFACCRTRDVPRSNNEMSIPSCIESSGLEKQRPRDLQAKGAHLESYLIASSLGHISYPLDAAVVVFLEDFQVPHQQS